MPTRGDGTDGEETPGSARYVFGVTVRFEPAEPYGVDPATVETTLTREAEPPGEDGWLFFRDHLWRGELGDERFMRERAEAALGVTVESVDFRELRTDQAYLDALEAEIIADLDRFNADSVREVRNKYLGSSIRVRQ
jgi:hypothetical protein